MGVCLSLVCGQLPAQGRGGARRFTLSGTVVDGNNQPIAGVELSLYGNPRGAAIDPAISDAQGRFAFGGLAAGEYMLSAEGSGFGTVPYAETSDPLRGSEIRVGGDSGDKSVIFRIVPRGAIEGVVRDEFGDPMMRANVSLLRPIWREGRTTVTSWGQKSTDDRGRYRLGNLAPGTYIVCTGGAQNAAAPLTGPVDYAARVDNRYYARTCSRAFELSPGQRAQIDLTPAAGTAATVRGRVRNLPPQAGFSAFLLPQDDGQQAGSFSAFADASQGTFTARGVQPGHYLLRVQNYGNTRMLPLTAEVPLDVGGGDIDGLEVELGAQAAVTVAFQGVDEDRTKGFAAELRGAGTGGMTRSGVIQARTGEFQFQGLSPGRYRLALRTPAESCVESVKLDGSEMRGAVFSVAAGAALHFDVAVSQSCGAIQVRAVRDGEALPHARVVLLVNGTPSDPGELREATTDDEGGFLFSGLLPGRYLLWDWALEGKGAMIGPSSLAAVEQQATVVEVTAGEPVKVDVPVLTVGGAGQ
jgi:protocatechuate 3,4-dioxygenase beta subunit